MMRSAVRTPGRWSRCRRSSCKRPGASLQAGLHEYAFAADWPYLQAAGCEFGWVLDAAGSLCGVPAVDGEGDAEDEAGAGAAQPQHAGCDLVGPPEATDGLIRHCVGFDELSVGDHVGDHRGVEGAGADRVDANPAWRVLECCAAGEPDHAVLRGVVGGPSRKADEATE